MNRRWGLGGGEEGTRKPDAEILRTKGNLVLHFGFERREEKAIAWG